MANQTIKNQLKQKFINALFDSDDATKRELSWSYPNLKKKGKKTMRYLFIPDSGVLPSLTIHPVDESGKQFAPTIQAHRIYCTSIEVNKGKYHIPTRLGVALSRLGVEGAFGWSSLEDCFLAYAQPKQNRVNGWLLDLVKDGVQLKEVKTNKANYPIEMHQIIAANYNLRCSDVCNLLHAAGYRNKDGGKITPTLLYHVRGHDFYGLFAKHKV